MLEWLVKLLKALSVGKFTGSLQIRFKDGGISSVTKPKEAKPRGLKIKSKIASE